QLDQAGVEASIFQECLRLQSVRVVTATNLAYILLKEEFDALVSRKCGPLAKKFGIELAEIQLVFDYIQTLSLAREN
ncbi:RNA polymerase factor sigma-54, partial [Enterococcus faecalis]